VHNKKSRMSVCKDCDSQDFNEIIQEESRQLSWITEDIAALYKENSTLVAKIKQLNEDLENFEVEPEFYEEASDDDACEDVATDDLWRTELNSLERDIWLQKEVYLREQLMQQLLSLSQDISTLRHRHHHPPRHQHPHLPRHLWGHQTLQWRPPSPALQNRARKTRKSERLLRWIQRKMPMNLIDLL